MLEIRQLEAGYGETQVIHGLDLAVGAGRVLAVLGRNGAGKSTTLKAVMGLVRSSGGSIAFDGRPLKGRKPFAIAGLGIAYVPETRDIFPSLTVRENLEIAARGGRGRPSAGRSSACSTSFRRSRAGSPMAAMNSPAANSRCWPSAAPSR